MNLLHKIGLGSAVLAAVAIPIALAAPAGADTAARSGDVVGVGSDTVQNAMDFVLDGAPGVAGGYNNLGNLARVDNVFATGDANGRAVYDGTCGAVNTATGLAGNCSSTNAGTPNLLPGTVILRGGTDPVTRPNGSGAGVSALINDSGYNGTAYQGLPNGSIQYARMSRLPNSTEIGYCPTTPVNACGGLHVYRIATDQLVIAHDKASFNGPVGLSAAELVQIYECNDKTWNSLPNNSGGSTDTIDPLIPQSGSGTRNFFLADLQAANGGTAITLGSCVRTVEEHDPTGIYGDPSPADAIEPFSLGKLNLINSGYFANAGYKGTSGTNAFSPNQLSYETGTPADGNANYDSSRGLFIVIRNTDLASTTPFQPGSSLNWAQTLFAGTASYTPYVDTAEAQSEIQAAGLTPDYVDCGVNPSSC